MRDNVQADNLLVVSKHAVPRPKIWQIELFKMLNRFSDTSLAIGVASMLVFFIAVAVKMVLIFTGLAFLTPAADAISAVCAKAFVVEMLLYACLGAPGILGTGLCETQDDLADICDGALADAPSKEAYEAECEYAEFEYNFVRRRIIAAIACVVSCGLVCAMLSVWVLSWLNEAFAVCLYALVLAGALYASLAASEHVPVPALERRNESHYAACVERWRAARSK